MMVYCSKAKEELKYLEKNLQHLNVGIPNITTDEVPRRYRRHTTGVSGRFSRLLHRVVQGISCYHEHQEE